MSYSKIKIVHLTTFSNGGAGRAAYRIHVSLLDMGYNSTILFVENNKEISSLRKAFSSGNLSFKQRVENKVRRFLHIEKYEKKLKNLLPFIKAENAVLPFSSYDPLKHPIVKEADIIHLHWVCGFIDYTIFFKNCN